MFAKAVYPNAMQGASRIFWLMWLTAAIALFAAAPAAASTKLQTCLAKIDPAGNDAERLVQASSNAVCGSRQSDLGSGDFAVQMRFAPMISNPEDPLVFSHSSVWQDWQRVVFHYVDGTTTAVEFTSKDASSFLGLGATFQIPVPPRAAPLDAIHVQIRGSANWRGVLLGPQLMKRSEVETINGWLIALYAGFGGLSLALLAYNLALWGALRHRFQLHYCVMVGALAAYTFTASGALLLALPGVDNNDRLRLNYVLLIIAGVAALRFMIDYFGRETFTPWLRRAVAWISVIMLADAVAFALLAHWLGRLFDSIYFGAGAVMLCLVFPLLHQAWRAKAKHFWLFVVAWSAPVIASFVRAAHGIGLLEYNFWHDNGNLIALSIESLLSTMLIVARLRDLSAERDEARAGERSALRLANSDSLTGLLNRRAFMDLAIGRKQAHRLMLIDLDHFKAINDKLGHDTGDDVLRRVAEVIQSVRPPDSLAVRLGGEEFALLVPMNRVDETPPERLLEAVRNCEMPLGWRVTVSLGHAEGRVDSDAAWRRLYRLADSALYRAKSDGRDRACRATDFTEIAAA
jgi:diguanylate cyclase (GGDEF)-like protein